MPGGRMPGAGAAGRVRQRAQIKHISIGFYTREGRYMIANDSIISASTLIAVKIALSL